MDQEEDNQALDGERDDITDPQNLDRGEGNDGASNNGGVGQKKKKKKKKEGKKKLKLNRLVTGSAEDAPKA